MKTIRRKINLQEMQRNLIKLSDLTKTNYMLLLYFTEKRFSGKLDNKGILYIFAALDKNIYFGSEAEYLSDDEWMDERPTYKVEDLDKNNIIVDENLLDMNLHDKENEIFTNYLLKPKQFKNLPVLYNPDSMGEASGYLSSLAHFSVSKFKVRSGVLKYAKVKKHYYKPFFDFNMFGDTKTGIEFLKEKTHVR